MRALGMAVITFLSLVPFSPKATGQTARHAPTTLIVAHRGLFKHAPENTLAAFGACLSLRCGFELDISRTKDGHRICMHDEDVQRTTNGKGKASAHIGVAVLAQKSEDLEAALADRNVDWIHVRFLPTLHQSAQIHKAGKRTFLAGPLVAGNEPLNWRGARTTHVDAVLTDYPLECRESWRQPAKPAEQFKALVKEFYEQTHVFSFKAKTDEERRRAAERVDKLRLECLELAEKYPKDAIAIDALTQVITLETWLENNTAHPGWGRDSAAPRAIALLLRDHIQSDKLGETCRRVHYGFRKENERFLRMVLKENPHKEVQALACLRLAQFLNARLQRFDLIREQPELAKRYEGLFGKDYLVALERQDRTEAFAEIETFFEQAVRDYGTVKFPFGEGTVGTQAKSELHEIRHLSVGKEAQEIEGDDQEGRRFKLSDYRGRVLLLYFWSEY